MPSSSRIPRALCILMCLVGSAVTRSVKFRHRQHFFANCISLTEGGENTYAGTESHCAGLNVHAAPVGLERKPPYLFLPTSIHRSSNGDHVKLALSAAMQLGVAPRHARPTCAPFSSTSFLQLSPKHASARPGILSATRHRDVFQEPKVSQTISLVTIQHPQRELVRLPDASLVGQNAFSHFPASDQIIPEQESSVRSPLLRLKYVPPTTEKPTKPAATQTALQTQGVSLTEQDAEKDTGESRWYAMRTNFPPRYLRILAKKSEAAPHPKWYTLLTDFMPHVLKLTPE